MPTRAKPKKARPIGRRQEGDDCTFMPSTLEIIQLKYHLRNSSLTLCLYLPICSHAASTHCFNRRTFVSGPTPPGVGVSAPATSRTEAKSTSPTIPPCDKELMPTSMTVAPGRTILAVTILARPTAATSTSACRVKSDRLVVREWH